MGKFYKITPEGLNSVIDRFENISNYLLDADFGEVFEIEVIEMSEEEFDSLPEFEGF